MTVVSLRAEDGRQERSRHNRAAVADAMIECIKAGNLRPSAQEVATRAGVSPRTVFRHFKHMEALMEETTRIHLERVVPLIPAVVFEGVLQKRIRSIVNSWATYADLSAPMWRAGRIALPFSTYLQESDAWLHVIIAEHIDKAFRSELQQLTLAKRIRRRHSLRAILSHTHWEELTEKQNLSRKDAARTLEEALSILLMA